MFYVQGADDWPIYAQDGPIRIVGRLEQLGYDAQLWMVQVSGCRYAFDRSRPVGKRIVESDIDPKRTYSVAASKACSVAATCCI